MQKIKGEFQNRTLKKATEFTTKIQLKKMVDEMEKEIGSLYYFFISLLLFFILRYQVLFPIFLFLIYVNLNNTIKLNKQKEI